MDTGSVLLVDDDDLICDSLGRGLARQGYSVKTAEDVHQAISVLERETFDFVISDLVMDGSGGFGVLKRSKELHPQTAVIILTGFADLSTAMEAVRLGADDYVSKPCDALQLSERIRWCAQKLRPLEDLSRALAARELLLRETHHRVKNDFLMLSALVGLQLTFMESSSDKQRFEELRSKIQTLALVHEELFLGRNYKQIGLQRFLSELCRRTIHGFNPGGVTVSLRVEAPPTTLATEIAVPLGIIVTELLTNTMKHAFGPRDAGGVEVLLSRSGDTYTLIVKDDGVGLESESLLRSSSNLGMEIVSGLTAQICGSIRYRYDNGATFEITFPSEAQ